MSAIDLVLDPPVRDVEGAPVRRALPSRLRRAVGPFVFFDAFGPTVMRAGQGFDVRPHPHIGLATVTYLLEGEILHRDSLGSVQLIRPGDVNWMTAGSGIVHSERTPSERRAAPHGMWGVQAWVALPRAHEETAPAFFHHPGDALPVLEDGGARVRVITGAWAGACSPVATFSDTLYAEIVLAPGGRIELPVETEERAFYPIEGAVTLEGETFAAGRLAVLRPGAAAVLASERGARVFLIGGARLDGERHIWWNFVSSSFERIEAAAHDWREGRFPEVPGDPEFIPLPEQGPATVRYP